LLDDEFTISLLNETAINTIQALESASWPTGLAADVSKISWRFNAEHFMLGGWHKNNLIGLACWRLGWLDTSTPESFPDSFLKFSNSRNDQVFNAAFVYNLCIHPNARGSKLVRLLIKSVLSHAKALKCQYLVGDGRCPSYNGSIAENIAEEITFKNAINSARLSGQRITKNNCLYDPVLRFYHKTLDCEFLWVMPEFIPEDTSSGGYRVIFYKEL